MSEKALPFLRTLRPVRVHGAGASDVGQVSDHDDDTTLVRPDLELYLACDGAGGHSCGNVASALAAASVAEFLEKGAEKAASEPEIDPFGLFRDARRLSRAILYANRKIRKAQKEEKKLEGMGTTVVATIFSPASALLHIGYIGDSRCYRYREGFFELLTFDHSLYHDVLELRPELDDATLSKMPPNVLTRALGMEDAPRVSVRTLAVAPGDRYLLCSDGLTDAIEPELIAELLAQQAAPEETVQALIDAANAAGGPDNISAVVMVCEPVEESEDEVSIELPLPLPRPRKKRKVAAPPPTAHHEEQVEMEVESEEEIIEQEEELEHELEEEVSVESEELEADASEAASEEPSETPSEEPSEEIAEALDAVELLASVPPARGPHAVEVLESLPPLAPLPESDEPEVVSSGVKCVHCQQSIPIYANFCGHCGGRQPLAE